MSAALFLLSLPIAFVTGLSLVALLTAELTSSTAPSPYRHRRVLASLALLICLVAAPFLAAATGDCERWHINGESTGCMSHSGSYLDWNFWLWGSANWAIGIASYLAARVMNRAERRRSTPGRPLPSTASDPNQWKRRTASWR